MASSYKFSKKSTFLPMCSSASILLGALAVNHVNAQELTEGAVDPIEPQAAKQSQAGSDTAPAVEEVMVYGIKQSLMNAQDMKRDAATVVDVITASDITSLPDKSVVDALTRVPGVTVEVFEATDDPEHFGAEGSSALVRGLNRTLTQFNGRTSFSATQWGALNLSHIPSELVGAIEVQKNQTASMIEGGIAGTLNLITRKPFDSPGMMYGGSIKADYNDEAEEWGPNVSGLFSNRWETDLGEFGFLVSLAVSETSTRSEAVGGHDFYEKSSRSAPSYPQGNSTDGVGAPISGADPDDVYWLPPSIQARAKNDERDRVGFVSSLQWQNLDETLKATLEFIRSDGTAIWTERLVQNKDQLGNQFDNTDVVNVAEIPGVSGLSESFDPATGQFTHGVLVSSGVTTYGYAPETRYHQEETYVNDISLDVEWQVNDRFTLNSDLQYVDSGQEMFDNTIHSYFESDVWLDLRDKSAPQIGFLGDNFGILTPAEAASREGTLIQDANGNYWGGDLSSITDPSNVLTRSAMEHQTDSSGDALVFALDGDFELDEGWITNIKGGVRFSSREQLHKSSEYDWGVIAPEWSESDRRSVADYPEFQEVVDFGSDFHDGDAFVPGSQTAFYFPRLEWVKDLSAFENYYSNLPSPTYDPVIAALPLPNTPDCPDSSDANLCPPANHPGRDQTWAYTVEYDDAGDPFRTLASQYGGTPYDPYHIFKVEEKSAAAYVQVDFENNDFSPFGIDLPFRGNFGLRYVKIDVSTSGSREFTDPSEAAWADTTRYYGGTEVVGFPEDLAAYIQARRDAAEAGEIVSDVSKEGLLWLNGYSQNVSVEPEDFKTFLPSANIVVNLTDDLLLRASGSKAVYIPHLSLKRAGLRMQVDVESELVPESSLPTGWDIREQGQPYSLVEFGGYTASSVGGSNPFLVPEESINLDLGLEWYFAEVGSLSGVIFTKRMDNLIRKGVTELAIENPSTGTVQSFTQEDTWDNVGEATIDGFEISYQQTYDMLPGAWSGLGVQANFTYLRTDEDVEINLDTGTFGTFVDLPLEGLSPRSYNMIVFYENELLNTRLAYNFRSEYMLNSRDVIGKRPVYNDDRATLDYSFTYNVNDDFKVGFDLTNLTNEQTQTTYQYDAAGNRHPRNYFVNDRRFTLRASASF